MFHHPPHSAGRTTAPVPRSVTYMALSIGMWFPSAASATMAALRPLLLALAVAPSTPSKYVTVSNTADGVWWLEQDGKPFFSTGISNLNDGGLDDGVSWTGSGGFGGALPCAGELERLRRHEQLGHAAGLFALPHRYPGAVPKLQRGLGCGRRGETGNLARQFAHLLLVMLNLHRTFRLILVFCCCRGFNTISGYSSAV